MGIYKLLYKYALQLTGSIDQAHRITNATLEASVEIALKNMDATNIHSFMIVTCRNYCYDWLRQQQNEEVVIKEAAEILDIPVGMVRQAIRAIREGRFLDY